MAGQGIRGSEVVDIDARRNIAVIASTQVNHEKVCAERWADVKLQLKDIMNRMWLFLAAVIAGMGSIIIMLINIMSHH